MNEHLANVESACRNLTATGQPITFTTIAEHTGISRTTLYRNPQLRAVIEEHRHHSHDPRTLTGLTAEIGHLRSAVQASKTTLTALFGVGPIIAATIIGDVADIGRFPSRDRFAAYNGTAPIEVSSGERRRKMFRLSRR